VSRDGTATSWWIGRLCAAVLVLAATTNPGCGGGGVVVEPVATGPIAPVPPGPLVGLPPPAPNLVQPFPVGPPPAPVVVQAPVTFPNEPAAPVIADAVVPPGQVAPGRTNTGPAVLQILDAGASIMVISGRAIPPTGSRTSYTVVSAILYDSAYVTRGTTQFYIKPLPNGPVTITLQRPVVATMTYNQILAFNPYARGVSAADGAFEFTFYTDLITYGGGANQIRNPATCYQVGCHFALNVVESGTNGPVYTTPQFAWTP
jgi:hypothetical protein